MSPSLEELFKQYHRKELVERDPLGLVDPALDPRDFELISFITAGLAYGRVEQIQKSAAQLWIRLAKIGIATNGGGIYDLLEDNPWKNLSKEFLRALDGWVHRFNTAGDIAALLHALKNVSEEHGSLGNLFSSVAARDPESRVQMFCESLRASVRDPAERKSIRWFTCSPAEGSTCKRLTMWMRWMLRADEIDPGHWTLAKVAMNPSARVGPHMAFIPMDTHIHRWALENNLLSTKNPSWKAVREVTQYLRTIDPEDPARFDFSICHHGMAQFRKASDAF